MNRRERQLIQELVAACQSVVRNWEHGDLAAAVRICDEIGQEGQQYLDEHPEKEGV